MDNPVLFHNIKLIPCAYSKWQFEELGRWLNLPNKLISETCVQLFTEQTLILLQELILVKTGQ